MHAYASGDSRGKAFGVMATLAVLIAIASDALAKEAELAPGWIVSAPTIAASFGLLYQAVDATIWRWGWVRAIGIVDTPIIEGTYTGFLVSSYGGKTVEIRLQIEQRWTRLLVRFQVIGVETSTSRSVAASLSRYGHHDAHLTYTYKNEIRPGVADPDMSDHDGTADLIISSTGKITGRYFNARGRQGTMDLNRT